MSAAGGVAAAVTVLIAREREATLRRFRETGATSPATAKTAEELGFGSKVRSQVRLLEGAVIETEDGRYYLDEDALAERERRCRWIVVPAASVVLIALWLAL